jgi:tRNA A37 threonylcarbamoyladenosine modification protein TsaB
MDRPAALYGAGEGPLRRGWYTRSESPDTERMKRIPIIAVCTLLAWSAAASDVYVVTDSKGNRVYTDRPEQLPAEKVIVRASPADTAAAQRATNTPGTAPPSTSRSAAGNATQAEQLTADDLAKRCADARRRYEVAMNSSRLYEQAPNGERRYLAPEEINAARINAKQTMDTFCGGQ